MNVPTPSPILSAFTLVLLAPLQGDFSERDLKRFGASLHTFLDARARADSADEALAAVREELAAFRERGHDLLSRPSELSTGFQLGREFGSEKKLRGSLERLEVPAPHLPAGELAVAVRLPDAYDPDERAWPLLLALPDAEETPSQHLHAHWESTAIGDSMVMLSCALPEESASWEHVTHRGEPGGIAFAWTALRWAEGRFRIDPDRIYLAGYSRSAPMVLSVASYDPGRFAGVVTRGGDLGPLDGDPAPDNFLGLPLWVSGSGANGTAFLEALDELGATGSERVATADLGELLRWMDAHPRDAFAHRVRVRTGNPFPTRVAWLRVAPAGLSAWAEGEIDRPSNTIVVRTEGAAALELHLNDALVDLDRPVVVEWDGERHERLLQRSVAEVADRLQDGTADPGRLFTANWRLDSIPIPAPSREALPVGADPEFDTVLASAGEDVEALFGLARRWIEAGSRARADTALARILRLAPDHAPAREAAGWFGATDAWFRTHEAYERHLASQVPENAQARGLVEHRGAWIHPSERKQSGRGWTKDFGRGLWLSKTDRERLANGWALLDQMWIEPEAVDRVDRGLFPVDGQWLDLASANERRSRLATPWRLTTGHLILNTTLDRDTAWQAAHHAERALDDVRRVLGAQPPLPLEVTVLGREEQVDAFAFGTPDGSREPRHVGRVHTLGSAFLAERWFRYVDGEREHTAQGVGLWDAGIEHGAAYGVHSVRFAAALSYVEALDPSPKAVRRALAKGVDADFASDYYGEKRLPSWLRWGVAVHAERFFRDPDAKPDGDAEWPKTWSLDNLAGVGGLCSLDDLFAFELDPSNRDASRRLLISAGAAVTFLVESDLPGVRAAHEEFRRALLQDNLQPRDLEQLEATLDDHADALRVFARG